MPAYLAAAGELTEVPSRAPGRGPPYLKSQVLRRQALRPESSERRTGYFSACYFVDAESLVASPS